MVQLDGGADGAHVERLSEGVTLTRFAQLVLTDDQLDLVASALRDATNNPDITFEQSQEVDDLRYFFETARDEPSKFPVTGKMAGSIRTAVRRAKGAAQPQSRKNRRKARQERRMRTSKERRKFRAVIAKSYNEAVERMRQEDEEARIAHEEMVARLEAQPKFNVFAADGRVLLAGIPEEMIRPAETVDPAS